LDELNTYATQLFAALTQTDISTSVTDFFLRPEWWQLILIFLASSLLMINRLNSIEKNGFEGTLVGTLIMPYFSGFPNLCFAFLILKTHGSGRVVLENSLVNNLTNLTLILAIPCIIWGLNLFTAKKTPNLHEKINRLSLILSILALIFFSICLFFISRDGMIDFYDGMLLVAVFLFWQLYHLFDVLKNTTRSKQKIRKKIIWDILIVASCAGAVFYSIDHLLEWVTQYSKNLFLQNHLGFFSGILMVLPNAFLAVYYAAASRHEIAYSSQIGDCHICIPLCVGLFAAFSPISVPSSFNMAIFIIIGAAVGHLFFTVFFKKLPRWAGIVLIGFYAFFIFKEII